MARALWLRDVLEDLRREGVPVHYVAGWETRGSVSFDPQGVICHDTGGSANSTDAGEIGVLLNGSTSAPAPIAQLYLSRTTGVHLVATGQCYHALTGWAGPLAGQGNPSLIGIEAAANPGRPWPAAQYRWYVQIVAAICRNRGWDPNTRVSGHKEHQPGEKVDPQGVDMSAFRAQVRQQLTNPEGDDMQLGDIIPGTGTIATRGSNRNYQQVLSDLYMLRAALLGEVAVDPKTPLGRLLNPAPVTVQLDVDDLDALGDRLAEAVAARDDNPLGPEDVPTIKAALVEVLREGVA